MYTIGTLGEKTGLSVQTLRFYEREGLVDKPSRNASGHRTYDELAVQRLTFIKRAQGLGFTLNEIRELFELQQGSRADCHDVGAAAQSKLELVGQKIAALTRMKDSLEKLVASCTTSQPDTGCEIMECLTRDDGAACLS